MEFNYITFFVGSVAGFFGGWAACEINYLRLAVKHYKAAALLKQEIEKQLNEK